MGDLQPTLNLNKLTYPTHRQVHCLKLSGGGQLWWTRQEYSKSFKMGGLQQGSPGRKLKTPSSSQPKPCTHLFRVHGHRQLLAVRWTQEVFLVVQVWRLPAKAHLEKPTGLEQTQHKPCTPGQKTKKQEHDHRSDKH